MGQFEIVVAASHPSRSHRHVKLQRGCNKPRKRFKPSALQLHLQATVNSLHPSQCAVHPRLLIPNPCLFLLMIWTTTLYYDSEKNAPQFRVLVVGKANVGKTTILQALCGTNDNPIVFDRFGTEVRILWVLLVRLNWRSPLDQIGKRPSLLSLPPLPPPPLNPLQTGRCLMFFMFLFWNWIEAVLIVLLPSALVRVKPLIADSVMILFSRIKRAV